MDIPGPLVPQALGAIQLPPAAAAALPALDLLKGQALEAVLLEILPDGVRLQLPSGQELRAQGQLPFPAGSLLALTALPLPGGGGVRLQVLAATPPPTDPILVHLDETDGRGTRSLLALADLVFHLLTFAELLKLHALNLGAVEEQLRVISLDEPETPIRHQFLDRTLRH